MRRNTSRRRSSALVSTAATLAGAWSLVGSSAFALELGDILVIARDILGLTKANYNSCQLGESQPITVKYSDRVGEILLSNREMDPNDWQHNLKYYI